MTTDAERMIIDELRRIATLLENAVLRLQTQERDVLITTSQPQRQELLNTMVSASLPSAPQITEQVTVGMTETLLMENQSSSLIRVSVSNDDLAQPLHIGPQGVLVTTGERIRPQDHREFTLLIGEKLYGICPIGGLSARVSIGYDNKMILESQGVR